MPLIIFFKLLAVGSSAGIIAGFLGIGGGAVLTPLCMFIYPGMGVPDDALVMTIFGTNMFLVAIFSASAVLKHVMNNKVDWRTVFIIGPPAVIGSLTGGWVASQIDPGTLKRLFAVLLLVSSSLIIRRGSVRPKSGPADGRALVPRTFLPLLGFIAGCVGSTIGTGGGIVMIPALILLFAFPVDRVAATSSSVIIFIGLTGAVAYMWSGAGAVELPGWSTGYVWWSAAVPLVIGGVPMARLGAWLNSRIHDTVLQRIFGGVLLILSLKILFL